MEKNSLRQISLIKLKILLYTYIINPPPTPKKTYLGGGAGWSSPPQYS